MKTFADEYLLLNSQNLYQQRKENAVNENYSELSPQDRGDRQFHLNSPLQIFDVTCPLNSTQLKEC